MRKETVSLNWKEQQRVMVLNHVERGEITGEQAATLTSLSVRQVRRLLATYRKEGVAALAHGNRGRRPEHALTEEIKQRVVALAQGTYAGCNHYHLTELLAEREGVVLSRSSTWRILTAAGVSSPRRRRSPRHRCRRERYPQEGMLLQIDGSHHDWLEGRGPYLTLVGAIDDATGTVPFALFQEQEDTRGYFILLQEIIWSKGIPLALYSDQHGIFKVNPKRPLSLEEQLAGEQRPTQFGRAVEELGIQPIFALSPEAKGRIERLWGTFQDRLVSEMRLAGASTIEEANKVLWDFLPRFNTRFGVAAAQPEMAYQQPQPGLCLEGILCFKHQRTVGKDNTVRLKKHAIQLLPGTDRISYAHAKVEVQERLDGNLVVAYQGNIIDTRPAPPSPFTLRARNGTCPTSMLSQSQVLLRSSIAVQPDSRPNNGAKRHIPGPNHPWRKSFMVTKSQNC